MIDWTPDIHFLQSFLITRYLVTMLLTMRRGDDK